MSLETGQRLGPYEVVAPLGAGGMGEVYRVRDARLGREVAIKVLPADLATDPDRLRRFEQEAQALGALNHPNLLAVLDLGTHEGLPYLVFELLEGETLRYWLDRGALPTRKALEYAIAIAHGLGAAHEKGIVHRDLKPENVFVTGDGRIKILDFGLAKLRADAPAGSQLPTRSVLTGPGVVLGTAAYMSPEQVQGLPADHRSDIFSLGTLVYEMLSGQRPFVGDSAVQTMNAILEKDPPPLAARKAALPPTLEPIVLRCLEKRPEDRFRSAPDIAFALEAIGRGSASSPALAVAARGAWPRRLGALLAAFVAGLLAMVLVRHRLPGAGEKTPPSYTRLTFQRGIVDAARFARDGHTVAYSAAWSGKPTEVFSGRLSSAESRGFDLEGAKLLALSSSDEMAVALGWRQPSPWAGFGTLALLSLAGGSPREMLKDVSAADWAPDGRTLAIVRLTEKEAAWQLEFPIGNVLYTLPREAGSITAVRVSPRADRVAILETGREGVASVALVDRAGQRKTLSTDWRRAVGLAWTPSGDEIWLTGTRVGFARALYAVSLSGRERLVTRVPGPLTLQDLAPDGRVLLTHENTRREMAGRLAGDARDRDLSWLDYSWPQDLSADGRTLLFEEGGEAAPQRGILYLRKENALPVRLGETHGLSWRPQLSPDGAWALVFDGASLVRLPTGAGSAQPISLGSIELPPMWADWFPDGKRILVTGHEPGREERTFVVDLEGGTPRPITPEGSTGGWISPDSRRLFGFVGRLEVPTLLPVGDGDPVPVRGSIAPGSQALGWGLDDRTVWLGKGGLPTRIVRLDPATGREEPWLDLSPADPAGVRSIDRVCISPDGKHYVYSFQRALSDLYLASGLN